MANLAEPRFWVDDFVTGFRLLFRAFNLTRRDPTLFRLSLWSALVSFGSIVGVFWGSGPLAHELTLLFPLDPAGTWFWILELLVRLLVIFLGALTVPQLFLSVLSDPILERTHELLGEPARPFALGRFLKGIWVAASHAVLRLLVTLVGIVLLLPLHLFPGVGAGVWWSASMTWAGFCVAVEYLAQSRAQRLVGFPDVLRAASSHAWLTIGVGAAISALLFVPLLNLIFVPVATVAGVLFDRELSDRRAPGPIAT